MKNLLKIQLMKVLKYASSTVFVSFIISLIVVGILLIQPKNLWLRYLPEANVVPPETGKNLVVLTRENRAVEWDYSQPSHLLYPHGQQIWLVFEENVTIPPNSYGGIGSFYAVDKEGNFHFSDCRTVEPRCLDRADLSKGVSMPLVDEKVKNKLNKVIANSSVRVKDWEVWEEMKKRVPLLIQLKDVALLKGVRDTDIPLKPDMKSIIVIFIRTTVWIGTILNISLILQKLGKKLGKFSAPFVICGISAALVSVIPVLLVVGEFIKGSYGVIIFSMFALSLIVAAYVQDGKISLKSLFFYILISLKALTSSLFVAGFVLALIITIFMYLRLQIFVGDTLRYVHGSMFVYDYGRLPLKKITEKFGKTSILANYPPGPSIMLAHAMWLSGTNKTTMHYPGWFTGTTGLFYAGIILILHVALFSTVGVLVYHLSGRNIFTVILVWVLIFAYVPSTRGNPQASEAFQWPLYGLTLSSILIAAHVRNLSALMMSTFMVGLLLLFKLESTLITVFLLLPFAISILRYKFSVRELKRLSVTFLVSCLPYLIWTFDKIKHNVQSTVYMPINLSVLLNGKSIYIKLIEIAIKEAVLNLSVVLFFALFWSVVVSTRNLGLRIKSILAPLGVFLYMSVLIISYALSTEPSLEVNFRVSWYRLLVYPILLTILYVIDLQSRLTKRS